MKSLEELKKEALADFTYKQEQNFKEYIKQKIQSIIDCQRRIASEQKQIEQYKKELSELTVAEIDVEI